MARQKKSDLTQLVLKKLSDVQSAIVGKVTPADCPLCLEVASFKRPVPESSMTDEDAPLYKKLPLILYYSDDLFHEIRICPHCGTYYLYTLKTMTIQISYSTNDYDDFTPSEETCTPQTLDAIATEFESWPQKPLHEFLEKKTGDVIQKIRGYATLK